MKTQQLQVAALGAAPVTLTGAMISLFAFCCGAIVANIYYAQPIIGLIAPDIHMSGQTASLIVSLTVMTATPSAPCHPST